MQHLMKQYRLWNTDDRQGEEKEERMFIKGLCKFKGTGEIMSVICGIIFVLDCRPSEWCQ